MLNLSNNSNCVVVLWRKQRLVREYKVTYSFLPETGKRRKGLLADTKLTFSLQAPNPNPLFGVCLVSVGNKRTITPDYHITLTRKGANRKMRWWDECRAVIGAHVLLKGLSWLAGRCGSSLARNCFSLPLLSSSLNALLRIISIEACPLASTITMHFKVVPHLSIQARLLVQHGLLVCGDYIESLFLSGIIVSV